MKLETNFNNSRQEKQEDMPKDAADLLVSCIQFILSEEPDEQKEEHCQIAFNSVIVVAQIVGNYKHFSKFFSGALTLKIVSFLLSDNLIISKGASILVRSIAQDKSKEIANLMNETVIAAISHILDNSTDSYTISNILITLVEIIQHDDLKNDLFQQLHLEKIIKILSRFPEMVDNTKLCNLVSLICTIVYQSIDGFTTPSFSDQLLVAYSNSIHSYPEIWGESRLGFFSWTFIHLIESKVFNMDMFNKLNYIEFLVKWKDNCCDDVACLLYYLFMTGELDLMINDDFFIKLVFTTNNQSIIPKIIAIETELLCSNQLQIKSFFNKLIAANLICRFPDFSYQAKSEIALLFARICNTSYSIRKVYEIGGLNIILFCFDPDDIESAKVLFKAIFEMITCPEISNVVIEEIQNHPDLFIDKLAMVSNDTEFANECNALYDYITEPPSESE